MLQAKSRKQDPYSYAAGKSVVVASNVGQPFVLALPFNSQRVGIAISTANAGVTVLVGIDIDNTTVTSVTKGILISVIANGNDSVLRWDTFGESITGEVYIRRDASVPIYVSEIVSILNNQGA